MNRQRKTLVALMVLGGALVFIALSFNWQGSTQDFATSHPPADETTSEPTGSAQHDPSTSVKQAGDTGERNHEAAASQAETADLAKAEPADEPEEQAEEPSDIENIWEVPAERFAAHARQHFDRALSGDLQSARQLIEIRYKCSESAPYTTFSQEHRLQLKLDQFAAQRAVNPDFEPRQDVEDNPWSSYETPEENLDLIQRWDRACLEVAAMLSPEFRERMDQRAEAGDVIARYIYATWPPDQLPPWGQAFSFDERQRWDEKAQRYSALNLAAGELAGLLAFGDSFSWGLFTGKHWYVEKAFALAAVQCGYPKAPDGWVNRFINREIGWEADTYDRIQRQADSLATLCEK